MIKILLFAGLREMVEKDKVLLPEEMESLTVREIKSWMEEHYPQIKDLLNKSMCAVNQAYADNDTVVTKTCEVAFIPPVSGG